jgi:Flp pilus assembly protein TadG
MSFEYPKVGLRQLLPGLRQLRCDRSGATAVEFAFIGPIFTVLLFAIAQYGGYFWLAHSVQQLANDGARAGIAGLSQTERQQLASATVTAEATSYASLTASLITVTETEQSGAMTVSISYNAAASGFWAMSFIPMPSPTIARSATVLLGGY